MPTSTPAVRDATVDDLDTVTDILTAGFADDPVSAWLIDQPADRATILADYFRLFTAHALTHGAVHLADHHAAAVWLPHNAPDDDLNTRLAGLAGRYAARFDQFGQIMNQTHPTSPAHDYLMLLATTPGQQGHGLGAALLHHRHTQLAATSTPTYLEATTSRAAAGVYARAGYRRHGPPLQFPDGLVTYPLWRDPDSDTPDTAR